MPVEREAYGTRDERLMELFGDTLSVAKEEKVTSYEAGYKAAETSMLTLGGFGYAKEFHIERLLREVMLFRIAPVSPQLLKCYIAEKVLGLPKSY